MIPWNKGKKGSTPWNKGKGKSQSIDLGNFVNVQELTGDKRSKGHIDDQGYRRYKIKGKPHKEHRLVWEQHNGQIPNGFDIHHIDGNKLNNDIKNLEMIQHGRHSELSLRAISI